MSRDPIEDAWGLNEVENTNKALPQQAEAPPPADSNTQSATQDMPSEARAQDVAPQTGREQEVGHQREVHHEHQQERSPDETERTPQKTREEQIEDLRAGIGQRDALLESDKLDKDEYQQVSKARAGAGDAMDALGEAEKSKQSPQFDFNAVDGQLEEAMNVAKKHGMPYDAIASALGAIKMVQNPGGSTISADQVAVYIAKAQQQVKEAEAKGVQEVQEAVGNMVAGAVAGAALMASPGTALMASPGTGAVLMAEMLTGESQAADPNAPEKEQERQKTWSETAMAVLASVGIDQGSLQKVSENLGQAMAGYSNGLNQLLVSMTERGEDVANVNAPGRDASMLGELASLEALPATVTRGTEAARETGRFS